MILIGYSGHAFVIYGILKNAGLMPTHYCDMQLKEYNPFDLTYLGKESEPAAVAAMLQLPYFVCIGDNKLRAKIQAQLQTLTKKLPVNAIHTSAIIDTSVKLAASGIMISAGAVVNPLAEIQTGVIINTGALVEHECRVGAFAHIGPGAVLCGNVQVGSQSFVGAGAVVRQGIHIGDNAMIGAGAVVVKDVPDNVRVLGCPAK